MIVILEDKCNKVQITDLSSSQGQGFGISSISSEMSAVRVMEILWRKSVEVRSYSSTGSKEGVTQKAEQAWTSGQQTLGFLGTCMEEPHGIQSWGKE